MLGSISDLSRLPAALFVVDVMKEKIAVREAQRLGIPVFAMVDTNSNPEDIDFVIPANDDASQSIKLIVGIMTEAVREGLTERKFEKEVVEADNTENQSENEAPKKPRRKVRAKVTRESENKAEAEAKEE